MIRSAHICSLILLIGVIATALGQAPAPKAEAKVAPKFAPVAETKLLMEGMALANYRGLETLLKQKPADADAWAFVRGQALLIGETGNLLLIRPPHNKGQDAWFRQAMELRSAAVNLARHAGLRDYRRSRAALIEVANVCNRCHQSFRVDVLIGPEKRPPPAKPK